MATEILAVLGARPPRRVAPEGQARAVRVHHRDHHRASATPWPRPGPIWRPPSTRSGRRADRPGHRPHLLGTHPSRPWTDQTSARTPATPSSSTRWTGWPSGSPIFGVHFHVGVRSPERAVAIANGPGRLHPAPARAVGLEPVLGGSRHRPGVLPQQGLRGPADRGPARAARRLGRLRAVHGDPRLGRGASTTVREVWWDIRPHPDFGTIELRMCDGIPTLRESPPLAALASAWSTSLDERSTRARCCRRRRDWVLRQNKWRAARYGIEADADRRRARHHAAARASWWPSSSKPWSRPPSGSAAARSSPECRRLSSVARPAPASEPPSPAKRASSTSSTCSSPSCPRRDPYVPVSTLRNRRRVVVLSGCGDAATSVQREAEPVDLISPEVGLSPPGSPLVAGLVVPPGTQLVGPVFPEPWVGLNGERFTLALMVVDGDPFAAWDDLACQADAARRSAASQRHLLLAWLEATGDALRWGHRESRRLRVRSAFPGRDPRWTVVRLPEDLRPTEARWRSAPGCGGGPRARNWPSKSTKARIKLRSTSPRRPTLGRRRQERWTSFHLETAPPFQTSGTSLGSENNCFEHGYDNLRVPDGARVVGGGTTPAFEDFAAVLAVSEPRAVLEQLAEQVDPNGPAVGEGEYSVEETEIPGVGSVWVLSGGGPPGGGACSMWSSPDGRAILVSTHSD